MKVTLPVDETGATVEIEWTDATTAALIAGMDAGNLSKLEAALRDRDIDSAQQSLVDAVRETLESLFSHGVLAQLPALVAGVAFGCEHWDNGWFLTGSQITVFYVDGTSERPGGTDAYTDDVLDELDELLNAARDGNRHDRYHLSVDLRTGKVEQHNIWVDASDFGLPKAVKA